MVRFLNIPSQNLSGETHIVSDDEEQSASTTCQHQNCRLPALFNYGDNSGSLIPDGPQFCQDHKLPGMIADWEYEVCIEYVNTKMQKKTLPTQTPGFTPFKARPTGGVYKSVKPNDTTNRLEKDKLLELGVELFGPGPDNNWDPLLLATKYEEFRLSVPDQTKKFKFMNAVTVSNFILKACKARASQQALMTDDPSVKVRVDQLLQMDTPTSRVPDLVRTDNVALHVANTSDTMLSESDRTQLSHPPHPQPVNVGEPCPFLVMCQEGTDLIPQHLRRTRTKSGKIAKKKKRQLGDIEVDEKERHCTECLQHYIGITHPCLEGKHRHCPVVWQTEKNWHENRLPVLK